MTKPGLDLVVTLGPASFGSEGQLAAAGASAWRINASHMTADAVRGAVLAARRAAPALDVVVDLQGAKMRVGAVPERPVAVGATVVFSLDENDRDAVPLPHAEVFAQVRPGETLSADDDRLRFEVTRVSSGRIATRVLLGGLLRPRKGVNVVEHPVVLDDLAAADRAVLGCLEDVEGLAFAVSFMLDGAEAAWVRGRHPGVRIVGKIERREATERLASIAAAVDALWICRGDLGAQLGAARLARFVSDLDPRAAGRPVLMAGQVLEHLTRHSTPTRSEVCHLYDLVARGYAGIVLSDETATGADAVAATRTAAGLLAAFRD